MNDGLLETALDWHRAGIGAAVATVVETWGSAPRPMGAHLIISGDGEIEGSVSGGCVEGAVIVEALEVLETGKPRILTYGVADEDAFSVGLACGGTIRILVEAVGKTLSEDILHQWVTARSARDPMQYQVDLETLIATLSPLDPHDFGPSSSEDGIFTLKDLPPLQMVIIGGVHIAQHLVPLAKSCGFDPIIIDPRPVFAAQTRFPDAKIIDDWPEDALPKLDMDARTAVITLTHDPKLDDPALRAGLDSDAFYIGSLGSRKTHGKRIDRLTSDFDNDALSRIHGPVGLNIGAKSPAEIALSIMAEVTLTLRGPK